MFCLRRTTALGNSAPVSASRAARLVLIRSVSDSAQNGHNPLRPSVPVSDLGLPLEPQPVPLPTIPQSTLVSSDLERLHRLSALDPPVKGSKEEAELLKGLNELVGLMEVVKAVELPQGKDAIGELLTHGVGEVVIGEHTEEERGRDVEARREVHGRDLLQWATRRKGDYYHSRAVKRSTGEA